MAIDYDEFRATTWEQRIAIFSSLSSEGKADLVRSQMSGWLERHRTELTPPQIEFIEEVIAIICPELYRHDKDAALLARMKDFEKRIPEVLTRQQAIDALTMQWGLSCGTRGRLSRR